MSGNEPIQGSGRAARGTGKVSQPMSEAALQSAVLEMAQVLGWRVAHFRAAPTRSGGWATPMQGNVGFPDAVLARSGIVLFVEFKSARGRLSPEQVDWAVALQGTSHVRHYVWRPDSWLSGEVEAVLRG